MRGAAGCACCSAQVSDGYVVSQSCAVEELPEAIAGTLKQMAGTVLNRMRIGHVCLLAEGVLLVSDTRKYLELLSGDVEWVKGCAGHLQAKMEQLAVDQLSHSNSSDLRQSQFQLLDLHRAVLRLATVFSRLCRMQQHQHQHQHQHQQQTEGGLCGAVDELWRLVQLPIVPSADLDQAHSCISEGLSHLEAQGVRAHRSNETVAAALGELQSRQYASLTIQKSQGLLLVHVDPADSRKAHEIVGEVVRERMRGTLETLQGLTAQHRLDGQSLRVQCEPVTRRLQACARVDEIRRVATSGRQGVHTLSELVISPQPQLVWAISLSALSLVGVPGALCAQGSRMPARLGKLRRAPRHGVWPCVKCCPGDAQIRSGRIERICPHATYLRLWAGAGTITFISLQCRRRPVESVSPSPAHNVRASAQHLRLLLVARADLCSARTLSSALVRLLADRSAGF
jgi:hypothetical protein